MALLFGPLMPCPRCSETTFGRCMVKLKGLVFKCNACGFFEVRALPPLKKKIVYLDQFAISKMIKNIDDPFWSALHDKLIHLTAAELITCPFSPIHVEESKYDNYLRDGLKAMYRKFAGDDEFREPEEIEKRQLARSLRAFIGCTKSRATDLLVDDAFENPPHRWSDVFHVYADFPYNEQLIQRMRQAKDANHEGMVRLRDKWLKEGSSFLSQIKAEERVFHDRIKVYRDATDGNPDRFAPFSFPSAIGVVDWLANTVKQIDPDDSDPCALLESFANSDEYRSTPYTSIWCRIWSKIAEMVCSPKGSRKPKASDLYDATVLAAYAPYCDMMFVDGGFRDIARDGRINIKEQFGTMIYSEQVQEEFLDSLREVESSTSVEHWNTLRYIRGSDATD